MEENFGWTRKKALAVIGGAAVVLGLVHIVYNARGFLAEWDYWAGEFGLVVLALVETILFVWVFGPKNAWRELHEGASIRIPGLYRHILTWVTPLFLLVMLVWWTVDAAIPTLLMEGVPEAERGVRTASRLVLVLILVTQLFLIRAAWRRRSGRKEAA
jgi:neurotransmitter:Na+ symporter, NSS family